MGPKSLHKAVIYHAHLHSDKIKCMTPDYPVKEAIFGEIEMAKCIRRNDINAVILLLGGDEVMVQIVGETKEMRNLKMNISLVEKCFIIKNQYTFGDYALYLVRKR